ncbi:unnamed protein product, partial [Discosporangium mesarthrocarpum]
DSRATGARKCCGTGLGAYTASLEAINQVRGRGQEVWCLVSGATSHMTPNRAGLTRFTPSKTKITPASGLTVDVHGHGSQDLTLLVGNDEILVRLKRVAYVP